MLLSVGWQLLWVGAALFAPAVATSDGPARLTQELEQEADPADVIDLEPATHVGSCLGDINGDGIVGLSDLAVLLGNWSKKVPAYDEGDLDGDGIVGQADLAILLSLYGESCLPITDALFELVEGGFGPAEDDSDTTTQLTWCRYTLKLVQGRNCPDWSNTVLCVRCNTNNNGKAFPPGGNCVLAPPPPGMAHFNFRSAPNCFYNATNLAQDGGQCVRCDRNWYEAW
jgi:hypothetical protein